MHPVLAPSKPDHPVSPLTGIGRSGFTLIEILAVVILLGLLFVAVAGSITGLTRRNQLADLVEGIHRADIRARETARTEGHAIVRAERDRLVLLRPGQTDESLFEISEATISVTDANGRSIQQWTIDHRGVSPDLRVEVRAPDAFSREQLLGLTGQWLPLADD